MSKKFIVIGISILAVVVLVLVAAGVWIGSILGGGNGTGPSRYSAVLLSNGDMYFGKLSWFPMPHLSKVWALQRQVDENNQQQLGVAEFSKAFWGPVDELYLNPKEIVWWSRLRNDSQLAQAMSNPSALQQQIPPQQDTGAFRGPSDQPPTGR